jgi:hypothetical protein
MALTEDRSGRLHQIVLGQRKMPVAADAVIYLGALTTEDADGYHIPNDDVAGDKAIYLALEHVDNTGGADGDKDVLVMTLGVALLDAGTLVQADVGTVVHATDDETLALTSTNNRFVGRLLGIDGAQAAVRIG